MLARPSEIDFAYDVPAADADPDDVLTFALSAPAGASVPAGMTIDPELGRIRWAGTVEDAYPLISRSATASTPSMAPSRARCCPTTSRRWSSFRSAPAWPTWA